MHDFRKRGREPRRAIDGFLRVPRQSNARNHASVPARQVIRTDRFRGAHRLDDFKRTEGYHPAARSSLVPAAPAHQKHPLGQKTTSQASILHMTLPGGTLDATSKKESRQAKRKGGHSKWRSIRKWGFRSGLAVAGIALLLGGYLVTKGLLQANKVLKGGGRAAALRSDVKPELLKGEGDGRINVLLLGKGGDNHEGPDLTDTLIVVSIDPLGKTAHMVSIPRDLWVTVQGYGSSKINAVYANHKYRALNSSPKDKQAAEDAGLKAIKTTVTQILGIPIHYHGMVDFKAFKQAVDTVGGVDITVPEELAVSERLWDETSGRNYYLDVPAGQQHFDGTRALFFTRSRYTSPRGDFDRSERQRLFIQALTHKVLSAGTYTNPVKVSQLMSDFGDHVSTDFSINDSIRLANIVKGIQGDAVKSIGLADPPNNYARTDAMNGQSVVRPTAGFGDYSEIHNFIRNTLKDPFLAKENAAVMVLNGTTTPGLASSKGDELKSFGYNVVKVETAPTQEYAKTVIIDVSGGKKPFTKNYLEKRLGLQATTKLPDPNIPTAGVDFVVILGQDETSDSQN